jgi:hypothetical protein
LKQLYKYFIYTLLFAPIIGYFSYNLIGFLAVQVLSYSVIVLFLMFIVSGSKNIIIPKFLYYYIFYIIYIFIWQLYNGYIQEKGVLKYLFNNFHLYTALIIIIIYNVKLDESNYLNSIKVIKFILFIALFGVLIQLLVNPNFFIPTPRSIGWADQGGSIYLSRRPSVFAYVSDNESGISVLAYFSLVLSLSSKEKNVKQIVLFSIIIGLYAILTNSRYVMLGFVLVVLQLFIDQKLGKSFIYAIAISIGCYIAYYIYTNNLGFDLNKLAEERLFAEGDIQHTSRYLAYELFLKYFPEHPFFGTGVHLTREIRNAANAGGSSQIHVAYFSHMVSYGIIGSFLLFAFWVSLALDLFKKARRSKFYGAFFGFLVFLWANAVMVDYNIFYPGIIMSIIFSEYNFRRLLDQRKAKISLNTISSL